VTAGFAVALHQPNHEHARFRRLRRGNEWKLLFVALAGLAGLGDTTQAAGWLGALEAGAGNGTTAGLLWLLAGLAGGVALSGLWTWFNRRRRPGARTGEPSLAATWERYYQVLENTSDLVGFATPDRKFFYANKAARKILGLRDDQSLEHLTPADIYPPAALRLITEVALPAVRREGIWEGKNSLRAGDGREVPIWQVLLAHRKPDGEVDFISSISRDMTEIVRAEEALRISEERFSKAFHGSPNSITITRMADGLILEANEGFERMFGHPVSEALGRFTTELALWAPGDRAKVLELIRTQGRVRDLEGVFRRKNGSHGVGLVSMETISLQDTPCLVTIVHDISERKEAEAALQASQTMLQLVLDSIPVRVFWKNREGQYLGCNQTFAADACRASPREIVGLHDFDISPPEQAQRFRADDVAVMESGRERLNFEESLKKADGTVSWLRTSKLPLRDATGDVIGVLGVYEDITNRKEVELALRDREEKLRLALDAAEMGTWEWNVATDEVTWTDRVVRIFGLRPGVFRNTFSDYRQRIHHDDVRLVEMRINEALRDQAREYQVEHRILRPDGEIRWVEGRGTVVRDDLGRPLRMAGTVWDVTARKSAENNLLRIARGVSGVTGPTLYQNIVATLAEVTGAPITFLGRMVNDSTIESFAAWSDGLPAENFTYHLAGTPCSTVISGGVAVYPADVQVLFPADQRLVRMGIRAYAGAPLRESSGRIVGLLVALFRADISRSHEQESIVGILAAAAAAERERFAAESGLRRANTELEARVRERTAELEAFSYSVSHDLRAPLRNVGGFIELLRKRLAEVPEPAARYMNIIHDETQRMGQLIDDLLEFSRLGRAQMRRDTFSMNQLVEQVFAEVAPDVDRAGVLTLAALPDAPGDRSLLRQVWSNLLDNAVKYSRRSRPQRIEVGVLPADADSAEVVYYVRDNGVGFDMRYVNKLFGVFQRLHSAAEFEGTGIGLANVQRIVRRHGGRVWAEGRVGQGATFYFALPNGGA
jgi:PAS domain S-box-containing protein